MATPDAEIAIIGAGVIGSALAMALVEQGVTGVVVYDPDLEGVLSSTELNAGGVRASFHHPANIECSKLSIEYFARHAQEIGYRAVGYLWLQAPDDFVRTGRAFPHWEKAGWPYEVWDRSQLLAHAPFIDRADDLAGAVFVPRDGLLNSNLLKLHFRNRAKAAGATFVNGYALREAQVKPTEVELGFEGVSSSAGREQKVAMYRSFEVAQTGPVKIRAKRVVNCAGPWAKEVAKMLGYGSPSYCVRRQISLFDCRQVDLSNHGMIVDTSGVYFHPEAGLILGGIAERGEPRGQNFDYSGEDYFQEKIWMPLSERSSHFESLRHLNGWGGLYEVSPDESAIIGEVETGSPKGTGRVFESHSYSGHGVMHSYACGVALAESLLRGRSQTVDLLPFSATRFEKNALVLETAVI